jgi:hypothetical protein
MIKVSEEEVNGWRQISGIDDVLIDLLESELRDAGFEVVRPKRNGRHVRRLEISSDELSRINNCIVKAKLKL